MVVVIGVGVVMVVEEAGLQAAAETEAAALKFKQFLSDGSRPRLI